MIHTLQQYDFYHRKCCMSWDVLLIYLPWSYQAAFRSPRCFFILFFCMQENELKHSVCSNWKCTWGTQPMWALLSLYVFVWVCGCVCLCMPVCRQWGTDAERCVLIFALHWAPLAVMLGCSDVTHVSLQNIRHRNDSAGWSKWHVHPLYIYPPLSLLLCHSLPVARPFTHCAICAWNFNIQSVIEV